MHREDCIVGDKPRNADHVWEPLLTTGKREEHAAVVASACHARYPTVTTPYNLKTPKVVLKNLWTYFEKSKGKRERAGREGKTDVDV